MAKNQIELNDALMEQYANSQAADFLLESAIYKVAIDQRFSTSHGGAYRDRVTGKTRQYDIRAIKDLEAKVSLELAIECKALNGKAPILINRIPRMASESYHHKIIAAKMFGSQYAGFSGPGSPAEDASVQSVTLRDSLYPPNMYVGKSITQVKCIEDTGTKPTTHEFSGKNEELYEKWNQAMSSAYDLIKAAAAPDRREKSKAHAAVILPLLVVSDDTLWVADYSEGGTRQGPPKRIDEATLYLGESYDLPQVKHVEFLISHLHVMTKTRAIQFLTDINCTESAKKPFLA